MTNTIPNVPRELLERAVRIPTKASVEENHAAIVDRGRAQSELRALLSAPSPAGADGLEVVGWYRMDGRKDITPYPSVCATWHKMGVKVGAAYSDSAHAIIDGLRGEVDKLMTTFVRVADHLHIDCEKAKSAPGKPSDVFIAAIDQQAQRIGELEGLLREAHDTYRAAIHWEDLRGTMKRIDAALSAGKEGE